MNWVVSSVFILMSSAMGAKPPCDRHLSTSVTSYLQTLKTAVRSGDILPENLVWLIEQPEAVDPILSPKRPENLSFKQIIRIRELHELLSLCTAIAQSLCAESHAE